MYIYIKPLEDGNCFSAHLLYNGIDKLIEGGAWGSYESAVEAALLYVLKKINMKREDIFGSDVQWIEN